MTTASTPISDPSPTGGRSRSAALDVAIIGGGPAGSAAARRLATKGHRVGLFERQTFPRFHIGESLLPASNRVFEVLGIGERVRAERFVEKQGASFVTEDGALSAYIDFTDCSKVEAPLTYQVPRDRFDHLLLEAAREAGTSVHTGCRVKDVEWRREGVVLGVVSEDGGERQVSARAVLDASGQSGFLAKRLALRRIDPELRNVAAYAHFRGVPRPEGPRAGDIRIVSRFDLGWIWVIPLPDGLTSIGAVMSRRHRAERGEKRAEDLLDAVLAETPVLARDLASARRVGPARFEADFSYAPSAYAGDRWLLAGDAGSFLDPVFSTGVLLALESGIEAAEALEEGLRRGDLSAAALAAYDRRQRRRYRHFRRFVRAFYDPDFRDIFFHPTNRFGLLDAVVSALAGNWRPGLRGRLLLGAFFSLASLQRRFTLVPRSHSRTAVGGPLSEPTH